MYQDARFSTPFATPQLQYRCSSLKANTAKKTNDSSQYEPNGWYCWAYLFLGALPPLVPCLFWPIPGLTKIDAAAGKTNTAAKKTMTAAIIGPMDGIIGPTGPWAPALPGPSPPTRVPHLPPWALPGLFLGLLFASRASWAFPGPFLGLLGAFPGLSLGPGPLWSMFSS